MLHFPERELNYTPCELIFHQPKPTHLSPIQERLQPLAKTDQGKQKRRIGGNLSVASIALEEAISITLYTSYTHSRKKKKGKYEVDRRGFSEGTSENHHLAN